MSFGDHEEIKKMIELFLDKSSLKKLHLKNGDQELTLEREGSYLPQPMQPPIAAPSPSSSEETKEEKKPVEDSADIEYIKSPMVGTFFAAPSPDQPNFVKVGDVVNEDTCICIIEAMKVMNEVKAGVKGIVEEVMVDNNHPVEFGTKIIKIRKQ